MSEEFQIGVYFKMKKKKNYNTFIRSEVPQSLIVLSASSIAE